MTKTYILLACIIFVSVFLRFYNLGQNPPSLTWDEVAWGYNAYSLGIDGRDEFGRFMPFDYLESFGDFKPPVYAYLDILPIKIFGLNEFAVRFPSAFFGTLTVLITFFLVKRIFGSNSTNLALISSLFLAISPWHINLSRAAFEANVATFFIISGVWFFLLGVQKKGWFLVGSGILFTLSLYTFNTARVVSPLLLITLAIGCRKELLRQKKEMFYAIIVGIVMVAPILKFFTSPQANLRFREVNIFSDIEVVKRVNQDIENDKEMFWSKIIHNRRFAYTAEYIKHYFDNFDPSFLFARGDGNPKFSTREVGQLYMWELPFLVIGALYLFREKRGYWWIVPLWLVLGIIPAATARETPHALRIETTIPTFQVLVAYGLFVVLKKVRTTQFRNVVFVLGSFIIFFNSFYYVYDYYNYYPPYYSGEWQYGYNESIQYVKSVEKNYDKILVTTGLGRPYVYYLFYMQVDPAEFRNTAYIQRDVFGFVNVEGFGKYSFLKDVHVQKKDNIILYVNIPSNVPNNASILKTFYLMNGLPSLVAYTL